LAPGIRVYPNFFLRKLRPTSRFVKCAPGTPVRKISAHEFERGGLTKPLVTTIDGTPTFLSPPVASEVTGQIRKKSRHDILVRKPVDIKQGCQIFLGIL
jgi:hypothetical protein